MTIGASKASWLTKVCGSPLARYVPRFTVITAADWLHHRDDCLAHIQRQFPRGEIAVRSSKHNEAAGVTGLAGHYRSFGPVIVTDHAALRSAVEAVFESYVDVSDADEVLLQAWVGNAAATLGVTSADATPYDATASVSYYVGHSTDAITAGWTNVQRFWLTANTPPARHWPSAVRRAFMLLASLEETLQRTALELEIAVDDRGRLRLLQVTPSTRRTAAPVVRGTLAAQQKRWAQAEREFAQRAEPRDGESGRKPMFGLMPDWNTAELLGEHPRPLAASLFETLISNATWRNARINLGCRQSAVHPLLAFIAGRPYVDVRASLNSLIPQGMPEAVTRRVVEAAVNKLRQQPELHDRVETALFPTCVGFAGEWSAQLHEAGLKANEQRAWHAALIAMESGWFEFSTRAFAFALAFDESEPFVQHATDTNAAGLQRALGLIRGTLALPFAIHARLAFVAHFQLASLIRAGALTQQRIDGFMSSVAVITSTDGLNARRAGGLRPATFDIRVQPVGNTMIDTNHARAKPAPTRAMFTATERRTVTDLLKPLSLNVDADAWLHLSLRRIELRERHKYRLSLALSSWLAGLTAWGAQRELSVEDLSFLTIKNIRDKPSLHDLHRSITRNQTRYESEAKIKLPQLLTRREDIRTNTEPALRPTFLGRGRLSGALCVIDRHTRAQHIHPGAMLLIRAADPGFDWIFAHPFALLITCYGGPHSHMAVRCAELNVPCVLGCGETVYHALSSATRATVDFDLGHLTVHP